MPAVKLSWTSSVSHALLVSTVPVTCRVCGQIPREPHGKPRKSGLVVRSRPRCCRVAAGWSGRSPFIFFRIRDSIKTNKNRALSEVIATRTEDSMEPRKILYLG